MELIRGVRSEDLDALYHLSLKTGHAGGDATGLYDDPKLIGHIYSAPYAVLSPETCFVAEDAAGVCGYVLGTLDTAAFENRLETDWWPTLRATLPDPSDVPSDRRSPDQRRQVRIHHPERVSEALIQRFPGHLHLNLLPRAQGHGLGRRLAEQWLDLARSSGCPGVHLGANSGNTGAITFWRRLGFGIVEDVPTPETRVWMARPVR